MSEIKENPGFKNKGITNATAGTEKDIVIQKNGIIRVSNRLKKKSKRKKKK